MKNFRSGRLNRISYLVGNFLLTGIVIGLIVVISVVYAMTRIVLVSTGLAPADFRNTSTYSGPDNSSFDSRRSAQYTFGDPTVNLVTAIGNLVFFGLFMLVMFGVPLIGGVSLSSRRLHDIGQSGWYSLILLIPFVGVFLILVLLFLPGDPKANKWGKVPRSDVDSVRYILGF